MGKQKYFVGLYEKIEHDSGDTEEFNYITSPDGLIAMQTEDNTNGVNFYYVHKDYLGSVRALTNQSGTTVEEYAYDAWGNRVNPITWQPDTRTSFIINRGYIGHEHLDMFNLININGRVYDPDLGMFLSPDPQLQAPDHPVNFNRYAYVLNNPLMYTDPSGESWSDLGISLILYGTQIANNMLNNDMSFSEAMQNSAFQLYYNSDMSWQNKVDPQYSNDELDKYYQEYYNDNISNYNDYPAASGGDTDNWGANAKTAARMFWEWDQGVGSANRTFNNDRVANSMRNVWKVGEAREFFYNKYSGVTDLTGASVTNYSGKFGLQGLLRAGIDPIEQYVGSYSIDINVISGNMLQYSLTNVTSMESFLYGIAPEWERSSFRLSGNTRQTYIFTEPIR